MRILLALPHSSAVLSFSENFSQVDAESADTTMLDLACRTLTADQLEDGTMVQVTEKSVVLSSLPDL